MPSLSTRIIEFNKSLSQEMLTHKYEIMAENAFSFYRGTCHLFYEDLYADKVLIKSLLSWLCGDLHLENFGSYLGENKLVYFDLNDFDEGILGPVSYELSRMLTSIFIAFETLKIDSDQAATMARQLLTNLHPLVLT